MVLFWLQPAQNITKNFLVEHTTVEVFAALHAVELSKEMSFNDIILEEDVLQIVNAIKGES
jgi:hypothetical protein